MQFDTRSATLIARLLMAEVLMERLFAAHLSGLPADAKAKFIAETTADYRAMVGKAIAAIPATDARRAVIVAELPGRSEAMIADVFGAASAPKPQPPEEGH